MSESEFEQAALKRLPKRVDPRKLVATAARFHRVIAVEDLPRLLDSCREVGRVVANMQFDRDDQHRPVLNGRLEADLTLECQRCLADMHYHIDTDIQLAIVWDEAQAKALPRTVDPWIVDSEEADMCAIVEEEILLQLPVVPKHNEECMSPDLFSSSGSDDELQESPDKPNPFSVLSGLKAK